MGFYQKTLCFSLKGHFSVLGSMERAPLLYVSIHWHVSLFCRDKLWGVCVSVLALLPRVLRLMLQSLRVNRAGPEELPVVGQLLRLLLQHAPLRTHMLTNAILVQQIIKNITVRSTNRATLLLVLDSWARRWLWEARVPAPWQTPGIKPSVVVS